MQLIESALAVARESDHELDAVPLPACNENEPPPIPGVAISLCDAATIWQAYRINYYD